MLVLMAGAELSANDSTKSSANSPDGVIYFVVFDADRLKGPTMDLAMSHMGTHIADIRSSSTAISSLPLYGAEFRAWQTLFSTR